MNIQTFNAVYTDDYRKGPKLDLYEVDEPDLPEDTITNIQFTLKNEEYQVFHLILDVDDHEVIFLRSFQTYDSAKSYAQQQYFLATGNYPFIKTGEQSMTHAHGNRPEIPITYPLEIEIDEYYEKTEFLIIMKDTMFTTHSLNCSAEW